MIASVDIIDPDVERTVNLWAEKINRRWQDSIAAIVDVGRMLSDAKDVLGHGHFEVMVRDRLPFSTRAARMLMEIPAHDWIADQVSNRNHGSVLPASWRTISQIATLSAEECEGLVAAGVINPDMKRADVEAYKKTVRRAEKHAGLVAASDRALAEIGLRKYALAVFDPPWETEARSEKGMSRNQANHYPTMSIEEIAALPIADMMLDHSAMFLWCLNNSMPGALRVLEAWGFRYVTNWVWTKAGHQGTGYWGRGAHELLLIGRKGDQLGPPADVPRSVWDIEYRGHSVKPHEIYSFLGDQYAGLPMVEGFAREPKDPRFDVWGNQAGQAPGGKG